MSDMIIPMLGAGPVICAGANPVWKDRVAGIVDLRPLPAIREMFGFLPRSTAGFDVVALQSPAPWIERLDDEGDEIDPGSKPRRQRAGARLTFRILQAE